MYQSKGIPVWYRPVTFTARWMHQGNLFDKLRMMIHASFTHLLMNIHVDGESENPQKEIDISPSHAINLAHTDVTLHLVQIDRAFYTCG